MIRRLSLLLLEVVAGLTAGMVILAIAGAWWLSSGPVTLTFLTPYIEEALAPRDGTITVEIDDTVIMWAGWDRAVNVRVNDVRLLDADRRIVAAMPQVSLGFSLRAMLQGLIAPTYIELLRPRLFMVRETDGRLTVGLERELEDTGDETVREDIILPGLIAELLSEPDDTRLLGYLRRIGIVDADLTVEDRTLGRIWRVPRADIALTRNATGISADGTLYLELEGRRSRIEGSAIYRSETRFIEGGIEFSGIDPALFLPSPRAPLLRRIADLHPKLSGKLDVAMSVDGVLQRLGFDVASAHGSFRGEVSFDGYGVAAAVNFESLRWPTLSAVFPALAQFARTDLPVAGSVSLLGTTDGRVNSIDFDLTGGAGKIELPEFYARPLDVAGLRLRGVATDNFTRIGISQAVLDLPQGTLVAQMAATRIRTQWSLRLDGKATDIEIDALPEYWPEQVAVDGREWLLANVRDGRIEEASLSLIARFTDGDRAHFEVESLHGGIRVDGASIDYFNPVSKVTGVSADMTFTADRFDIAIGGGRLRDLSVDTGSVVITKLASDDPEIAVDLTIRGPLQTALSVLNEPSLGFLGRLRLDPSAIAGRTATRMVLEFPLTKSLKAEQIAIAVGATLRDVALKDGPLGLALSDGVLELQVTGLGIAADGSMTLNGVPVTLDWQEFFSGDADFQRRITVAGLADNDARRALKLPQWSFLDGDVPTELTYTKFFDGSAEVAVAADLAATVLDFPQIFWRKPLGRPATLNMFVAVPSAGPPIIEELRLHAGDMRVNARIEPTLDLTEPRVLEFRTLEFAGNQLQGRMVRARNGGFDIDLTGARAVVTPYLGRESEVDARASGVATPVRLRAHIEEVIFGDGQSLHDVKASFAGDGGDWRALKIDADVGGGARLAISYGPAGNGTALRITTGNAGNALRALGWTDRIQGGVLYVAATQPAPDAPMAGKFSLKRFKASEAPALARVLQILSLTGIFNALSQSGLDFVTLDGDFRYFGGALEIKNTRAIGSSIGVTTEGVIFIGNETARLKGTVVPAYTINRILGSIPILGKILTGGKNEGVFAANYALRGRLENPLVSVNPLSVLAPGFLRRFVDGDAKPLPTEDTQATGQ